MGPVETKVTASTLGAALGPVVVMVLTLFGVTLDPEIVAAIAAALAAFFAFAAGYWKKSVTSSVSSAYRSPSQPSVPRVPYQQD